MFLFVISFYVLWALYKRYQHLSVFRSAEFSSICYLSIFTLLLLVFNVLGFKVQLVLTTLVLFKIVLLIGFFWRQLPLLKAINSNIIDLYALSFVAGIIGFYFLSNGLMPNHRIPFNATVFGLSFILLTFLFYNQKAQTKNVKFQKYAYILLPLGFIPFLPLLKTETYLTLNNYGHYGLSMASFIGYGLPF